MTNEKELIGKLHYLKSFFNPRDFREGLCEEIEQGLMTLLKTSRIEILEEVLAVLAVEDIENDPDDLYTGRNHRLNRIRAMKHSND